MTLATGRRGGFRGQEQPMSAFRFTVLESAVGTLTEAAFRMPVNPQLNLAMRVWKIASRFDAPPVDSTVAASVLQVNSVTGTLSLRQNLTTIPVISDEGSLYSHVVHSVHAGDASGHAVIAEGHGAQFDYGPTGLLIATAQISAYVQQASGGNNAITFGGIVYFTLETVSAAELVAALSLSETF